jgi:phosphatidylserine synthase
MTKRNSLLTILTVSIACSSIFFAMFGQFEAMLLGLTISFINSLFIK